MQHGKGDDKRKSSRRTKVIQHTLDGFGTSDRVGGSIGWDELKPEVAGRMVVAVTKLGGAVLFGSSRDGGALLLTVHLDGDRKNVWLAAAESLTDDVEKLCLHLEALR